MSARVARRAQSGVVLFIALIVLVAMTLAGLAAMRTVGTGVALSANLSFKQGATRSAEMGVESARDWLLAQPGATLDSDNSATGYYSSYGGFDAESFDWSANGQPLGIDAAGSDLHYVIHRLCKTANAGINAPNQNCVAKIETTTAGAAGASTGGVTYGTVNLKTKITPYYRITVRSQGPRETASYLQVILD